MLDIKLELYKVFYTVAKEGSFSLAAKKLFMTQSAVSQSIKTLEESLGVILFNRTPKGAMLNQQGQLLMDYISSAMELINSGEERIVLTKTLEFGELKMCASDTICRHLLLPYLEYFSKSYPRVKLKIVNRTSNESIAMLKNGQVDIAFVNLPVDDNQLEIIKSFKVRDIFVASERFRHLKNKQISIEQLLKLPLIFLEQKSNSRMYVENFIKSLGYSLHPEIELGSHDLLMEFSLINIGVACVVDKFAKNYMDKGLFEVKVAPQIPPRNIGVCILKGVSISPSTQKFMDIVTNNGNIYNFIGN
jgi:DNA-binding transcriptional LysR family regulator